MHSIASEPRTHERLSAEHQVILARGKAIINTQISIVVPPGTYGRVAPRSGLGGWHLTRELPFPVTHGWSNSCEVRDRHRGWGHRRRLPWYPEDIVV